MLTDLPRNEILCGDCIKRMKEMPENSIDAVVTDPPYGLAFMGKSWDDFEPKEYQEFCEEWGEQALRVLKPGGYLLAFSGTRTYHRMVCGLEDAGFEIKDQIDWLYGSGFPKSTDISKQIDKHFDKEDEREVVKVKDKLQSFDSDMNRTYGDAPDRNGKQKITAPATPEASKWNGWGTALKPAHEPIVLAQKPRDGSYAEHVLEYGVGGLNIDGCRIGTKEDVETPFGSRKNPVKRTAYGDYESDEGKGFDKEWEPEDGRWPANVVLDPEAAGLLDEQSGVLKSGSLLKSHNPDVKEAGRYGRFGTDRIRKNYEKNSGGASRFFYCAKAHKSERNAGLEDLDDVVYGQSGGARQKIREGGEEYIQEDHIGLNKIKKVKNDIATLKPINLMRYLVRLVTPPEGVVLDPFAGSGTTGCACVIEGFDYILIEKRKRFANVIAPRRIEYWSDPENYDSLKNHELLEDPETLKKQRSNATLENFVEE